MFTLHPFNVVNPTSLKSFVIKTGAEREGKKKGKRKGKKEKKKLNIIDFPLLFRGLKSLFYT